MTFKEGEHLEFEKAGKSFHFETLFKYCAALANEGGGKIVLGVTDDGVVKSLSSDFQTQHTVVQDKLCPNMLW
ncbi:ATP-binding protein [bacterium]|nr:ATP-binding protein [bacterium]